MFTYKKFKKTKVIALSILLLSMVSINSIAKSIDLSLDFVTSYIWRGFDLNPDKKPALQPSITYNVGETGLSFNIWSSISFETKDVDEFDLTIDYSTKLSKKVSLSLGFIHYGWYLVDNFTFKDWTTQEFYVSSGLDVFLSPTLSVYYDVNNASGLYANFAISHSFTVVKDKLNIDLSSSIGFNAKSWVDDSGFSDLNFGLAVPITAGPISITPSINVAIRLMDSVRTFAGSGDDVIVWSGLSIAY